MNIDPPEQTVMVGEMVEFECTAVALVRLEVKNPSGPNHLSPSGTNHAHLGSRGGRNSTGPWS